MLLKKTFAARRLLLAGIFRLDLGKLQAHNGAFQICIP